MPTGRALGIEGEEIDESPNPVDTCPPMMSRSVPLMRGSSVIMSSRRCSESNGDGARRGSLPGRWNCVLRY